MPQPHERDKPVSNETSETALLDEQEQRVRCDRMIIALHLRSLIEKSGSEYLLVPAAVIDQIKELRKSDWARQDLDFGAYVYSLITEYLLTHFSDLYTGYEWNDDDVHPEVYLIIERVAAV